MSAQVMAVLVGGPEDGREYDTREQVEEIHIPVTSKSVAHWLERESTESPAPTLLIAVYRLATNGGHPSLNDQGRRRYEYKGMK